jgi:mRNA interferase MazF
MKGKKMDDKQEHIKDFEGWNRLKQKLDVLHKPPFFNEREIWWCSLGVNVGFEVYGKGSIYTRPVLILKKLGKYSFLGVPLTSKRKDRPYHYPVSFAGVEGSALIGQIRMMDNKRLSEMMGTLGRKQFEAVRTSVKDMI